MKIIICGAGHVGGHAAEVLSAAKHSITLIDRDPERTRLVGDRLDVATLLGNCADARVLAEAGAASADMVIAATQSDEINLLTASIAKGLGAAKTVARIHHGEYYEQGGGGGFSYEKHFNIDRLICPEYATAESIAHVLRNPAAIAIESFARWRIEMQEFHVDAKAPAVGRPLQALDFPRGARLAAIARNGTVMAPTGATVIETGDAVVLLGEHKAMERAIKLFGKPKLDRRDVVVMGGTPMAVWFCRALRDRAFSIRLFEPDRPRAEALAEQLDWVTVVNADPTTRAAFEEEYLSKADVFVALTNDDEANILGGAWAKSMGVKKAVAVVQRPVYLHLLSHVGIDLAFSPRVTAARDIGAMLDDKPLLRLTTLARGVLDVFRVRVGRDAPVSAGPLKSIEGLRDWLVAAVQHYGETFVPDGEAVIQTGDVALVVGPTGRDADLKALFGLR